MRFFGDLVSVADFGGVGGGGWGVYPSDEMSLEWVMVSPILLPTSDEIDEAGRKLVSLRNDPERESEWLDAVHVVDQWRRAHSEPLRTFQANLRRRVKSRGIVATRLKRLPTIIGKLERLQRLRLSQLQDIGGCRVIVGNADDAAKIAANLVLSRIRHQVQKLDDYIARPRTTGYRGIHLVYSFFSERKSHLNGLNIEIQFRSRLQHQWATAVETVGAFTGNDLKSGRGDPDWLRFFALMSTAIARREDKPTVPKTPTDSGELSQELIRLNGKIGDIPSRLRAFRTIADMPRPRRFGKGSSYVLELDLQEGSISGYYFAGKARDDALSYYLEREMLTRDNPSVDVVHVAADSVTALTRAYPNYFANLSEFRTLVQEVLAGR